MLAVGETVVDFISHEFAVSALRNRRAASRHPGGQPANVAVYVAKLGGRSAVISKVGTDYFGEFSKSSCSATASGPRGCGGPRGSDRPTPSSPEPSACRTSRSTAEPTRS